ncbi:MAG: DUF488 family protein [Parcubacteria group bacterium]|jgi:uncharacterized protein YeaO (DUF488 family)
MIRTKCILLPATNSDGLRISVMSRHTLNDGTTPDERIWPCSFDLWLKDLAPPDRIVGKYYRGEITYGHYCDLYLAHLRKDHIATIVRTIARYALHKRVTFLCIESVPTLCHRTILLYECLYYEPELHIQHY